MSTQPTVPNMVAGPTPDIPAFEGRAVDATHIKITGSTEVIGEEALVISVDDRVHLSGDYKVVGVRHTVDKDGKLIREHILRPVALMVTPWDDTDPNDNGVIRALRVVP